MIVNKIICDGGLKFGRRFEVDSLTSPSGEMVHLWYDYVTTHDYLSVVKSPVDPIRLVIFKFVKAAGERLIEQVTKTDCTVVALREFLTLCEYAINTLTNYGFVARDDTRDSLIKLSNIHITDSTDPKEIINTGVVADMVDAHRNILLDMHTDKYDELNIMVVWAPTDISIPIHCKTCDEDDIKHTIFQKCIENGIIQSIEIEASSIYPDSHSYFESRCKYYARASKACDIMRGTRIDTVGQGTQFNIESAYRDIMETIKRTIRLGTFDTMDSNIRRLIEEEDSPISRWDLISQARNPDKNAVFDFMNDVVLYVHDYDDYKDHVDLKDSLNKRCIKYYKKWKELDDESDKNKV